MYSSYCDRICNPDYNMAGSCKRECPGYVFTTTSPPVTSGSGASLQHVLSTSTIIIACCTVGACVFLVGVAWFFRKKIKAIWNQIKFRFVKFSQEETGNGNRGLSTSTIVPGGQSLVQEEDRLITEEHHPCESDALLIDCPTFMPEDSEQNATLPIDPPGSDLGIASLPYPSKFSTDTDREQSSGYLSMDDRINHEEQVLSMDEHITNENTVQKTEA